MKIRYDHDIFSIQPYGGISRYCVKLAEEMQALAQDVRICAPVHINEHLNGSTLGRESRYVPFNSQRTQRAIRIFDRIVGRAELTLSRPDLVHGTFYSFFPPSLLPARNIITIHDMIAEVAARGASAIPATVRKFRRSIARADHLICISDATRREFLALFPDYDTRVSVVHHGFDRARFQRRLRNTGEALSPSGRPFLLYVGLRGTYKNFEGLLKAVASSPILKAGFDLVAFGGMAFSTDEQETINQLGFQHGQIRQTNGDDEALLRHYREAACFVYPSIHEGFGFPPLEAMAAGCPVASSQTSCMPEIIGDAAAYFDPMSPDSMAIAILSVVGSKERCSELVSLGYQRIERYSWDRCARETLDIYRRVTGKT